MPSKNNTNLSIFDEIFSPNSCKKARAFQVYNIPQKSYYCTFQIKLFFICILKSNILISFGQAYSSLVAERLPENGYPLASQFRGEIDWRKIEQGFSSFFAKFLPYLKICYNGASAAIVQYFVKSSNRAKIWQKQLRKALFNLT